MLLLTGIVIRLIGKGNVFWDTSIKHNNVFRESETYVNTTCQLLAPGWTIANISRF